MIRVQKQETTTTGLRRKQTNKKYNNILNKTDLTQINKKRRRRIRILRMAKLREMEFIII